MKTYENNGIFILIAIEAYVVISNPTYASIAIKIKMPLFSV